MEEAKAFTADVLLAESENESTYFLDFNRQCALYGTNAVYCFVENYDLCFYPHRIQDILGKKVKGVPCDGKKNVIATYALISSKHEYDKYIQRYFVDADFDDNSSIDRHIYVTRCYSIENLYIDKEVVSDIIENEYKIRRGDPDNKHEKVLHLFESELATFHSCVLLFNAWYRAISLKGIGHGNGVNLEDKFPSGMIQLNIGNITSSYNLSDIETKYPEAPKLTSDELNESVSFLRAHPERQRGKYEIQFLYAFFDFLNKDSKSDRKYSVLVRGVNWDRKRMISTLDHYVPTPLDMRAYIINGER